MRTEFIMMCGLPASGKSSVARKYVEDLDAVYLSSDLLRLELLNDINDQSDNGKVFEEMNRRLVESLAAGRSVVYDACNTSYKRRMDLLERISKYDVKKTCVVTYKKYIECLRDNIKRERRVPVEVIRSMLLGFYFPNYFEGWDQIILEGNIFEFRYDGIDHLKDLFYGSGKLCATLHHNHHHSLSIGDHSIAAYLICKERFAELDSKPFEHVQRQLCTAALFHDMGKPFVKRFSNSKGEYSKEAHYYQHHLVSAYQAVPYICLDKDITHWDLLDILTIIDFHMHPYFWEKDNNVKMMEKYKKLLGGESGIEPATKKKLLLTLYDKVMFLHEVDKAAH